MDYGMLDEACEMINFLEENNLSIPEIAKLIGISNASIYNWLNDKNGISDKKFRLLKEFYNSFKSRNVGHQENVEATITVETEFELDEIPLEVLLEELSNRGNILPCFSLDELAAEIKSRGWRIKLEERI